MKALHSRYRAVYDDAVLEFMTDSQAAALSVSQRFAADNDMVLMRVELVGFDDEKGENE